MRSIFSSGHQRNVLTSSVVSAWIRHARTHIDVLVFLGLLTIFNLHLSGLTLLPLQIFTPQSVAEGQWWRVLTHPLVHVSWYHLLLDAGAFLLLYTGLDHRRMGWKLISVGMCAGTSLIAAWIFVPQIDAIGLCGLSGTAHGLMAYSGLEIMRKKRGTVYGLISFWLVVAKSIYEMIRGEVMFEFLHLGMCGTALAPCHLGGVAGGILAYLMCHQIATASLTETVANRAKTREEPQHAS